MFAKFESVAALAALAAIFADTAEAFWGKGHLLGKSSHDPAVKV